MSDRVAIIRGDPEPTEYLTVERGNRLPPGVAEPPADAEPTSAVEEPSPEPVPVEPGEEPGISGKNQLELAKRRAKVFAISRHCQILELSEVEQIGAWVERAPCVADRELRMLCLDLLGKYLRTGFMNAKVVLSTLQTIHGFSVLPDTPRALAAPVPRREDSAG